MTESRIEAALIGALLTISACAGVQPCSKTEAARLEAECLARIQLECKQGDKSCPAYVDCVNKIEQWRTCR